MERMRKGNLGHIRKFKAVYLLFFYLLCATVSGDSACSGPFRLAIAMDSTKMNRTWFEDQKGLVKTIVHYHTLNLNPKDVAISLFDFEKAGVAIDFNEYKDLKNLTRKIENLEYLKPNAPGYNFERLFALNYNKKPNVFLLIKLQDDDTVYGASDKVPIGELDRVLKIAVTVGVTKNIRNIGTFEDVLFSGKTFKEAISGNHMKYLITSICETSAKKFPPLMSSDADSTPLFETTKVTPSLPSLPFTQQHSVKTKTVIMTSSRSDVITTSGVSGETVRIVDSAMSYSPTIQSSSSVINTEPNNLELLKKDYYSVLSYKTAKIDPSNDTAIKEFVSRAARLLQNSNVLDKEMKAETNSTGFQVLNSLESYSIEVAEHMKNLSINRTLQINTGNIVLSISSVNMATFEGYEYGRLDVDNGSLHIPGDIFKEQQIKGYGGIVTIIFYPFKALREGNLLDENDGDNATLSSKIITVTVTPPAVNPMKSAITIRTKRNKIKHEKLKKILCVFWNPSKYGWSTDGCHVSHNNDTVTECQCNHMTHYAVLMSLGKKPTPEKHRRVLSIISYIGCSMSIIGVFLTIVTFICLPVLKSERTRIHCNLSIAVGMSQILFLAAGSEVLVSNEVACKLYAAIMFYCFMSVFTWMLVEGVHLYQMVIIAFVNRTMMNLYYGIGWGLPLCIVVIASSISHQGYGMPDFCWISLNGNTIWAFTGPALFIILVNMMVLLAVLRLRASLEKTCIRSQMKSGARVSVVLLPLLGLTWVFGLFSAMDENLIFQYIFAITNSLQGVMIFAFHCVGNSEVRKEFQRKASHWNLMRTLSNASSMVTVANKVGPAASVENSRTVGMKD